MPVFRAKINVTLRPSILDPQGKAVHHAVESLGMTGVKEIRMGKYIEMQIEAPSRPDADRITNEACRKLLANPVMENFSFTIDQA